MCKLCTAENRTTHYRKRYIVDSVLLLRRISLGKKIFVKNSFLFLISAILINILFCSSLLANEYSIIPLNHQCTSNKSVYIRFVEKYQDRTDITFKLKNRISNVCWYKNGSNAPFLMVDSKSKNYKLIGSDNINFCPQKRSYSAGESFTLSFEALPYSTEKFSLIEGRKGLRNAEGFWNFIDVLFEKKGTRLAKKVEVSPTKLKDKSIQKTDAVEVERMPPLAKKVENSPAKSENKSIQKMVTFEVENSFTQEEIQKAKGLASRSKATVKEMKIKIRATMKNRPLNKDYKVKVETLQLQGYTCVAKQKTSYRVNGCGGSTTLQDDGSSTIQDNKDLGINEIILNKDNNWSATFGIDSNVMIFAVKEDWVAKYEIELLKLEIEPKVVNIESI